MDSMVNAIDFVENISVRVDGSNNQLMMENTSLDLSDYILVMFYRLFLEREQSSLEFIDEQLMKWTLSCTGWSIQCWT